MDPFDDLQIEVFGEDYDLRDMFDASVMLAGGYSQSLVSSGALAPQTPRGEPAIDVEVEEEGRQPCTLCGCDLAEDEVTEVLGINKFVCFPTLCCGVICVRGTGDHIRT